MKHTMAVRVPDWKKAYMASSATARKKILRRCIFKKTANTMKDTAAAARWTPKLAASEKHDIYLNLPPMKWAGELYMNDFSALVRPMFLCFHTQKAANKIKQAHTISILTSFDGLLTYMVMTIWA